jgi:hypothetical protein
MWIISGDERRRNLQAHVQNLLLALKADVGWPADHAAEVALGLDVLADAIVARPLLDERVLFWLAASLTKNEIFAIGLGWWLGAERSSKKA